MQKKAIVERNNKGQELENQAKETKNHALLGCFFCLLFILFLFACFCLFAFVLLFNACFAVFPFFFADCFFFACSFACVCFCFALYCLFCRVFCFFLLTVFFLLALLPVFAFVLLLSYLCCCFFRFFYFFCWLLFFLLFLLVFAFVMFLFAFSLFLCFFCLLFLCFFSVKIILLCLSSYFPFFQVYVLELAKNWMTQFYYRLKNMKLATQILICRWCGGESRGVVVSRGSCIHLKKNAPSILVSAVSATMNVKLP